ncbi:MAG: hypothetical protein IKO16_09155 [Lachnospiraceae bacterium]|nr:hypothetical protein [Lachnospiraceae bacterium]
MAVALYAFARFVTEDSWPVMLAKAVAFTLSGLCYFVCFVKESGDRYGEELVVINIVTLVFHLILFVTTFRFVFGVKYYSEMVGLLVWTIVPLAVFARSLRRQRSDYKLIANKLYEKRAVVIGALITAAVVIAISYDTNGPHFVWDSNLAYNHVLRDIKLKSLFEIRDMLFCEHIAFSYFYPVSILTFITGSVDLGMIFFNNLCVLAAALGFALLFSHLFSDRKNSEIIAAVAACMLSPYIFGMASSCMYDYAALCITPLVIYTACSRKWLLFFMVGLFACFIKEPSIIFFASACLVILIWELAAEHKKVSDIISSCKYWYMALIGLVFVAVYFVIGNYGSSTGETFGFEISHIFKTFKVFSILNFSWMLSLLSVICILYLIRHKADVRIKRCAYLCAVSGGIFLVSNCLILAPYNPRYIDYFYPCLLILTVILIMVTDIKGPVRITAFSALAVLFVLASFFSIDPVSNLVFYTVDTGDGKVYSPMSDVYFCDPSVYSRQYYGFDLAMNEVLEHVIDKKDAVLAISTGPESGNWEISGKWTYDYENGQYVFEEFWDNVKKIRSPGISPDYYSDPRYTPMEVKYIFSAQSAKEELENSGTFAYIYMPSVNGGRENEVRSAFAVTEEGSCAVRGWEIAYIRGVTDD